MDYMEYLYIRKLDDKQHELEKEFNEKQINFCKDLFKYMRAIPHTVENVKKRFIHEKEFVEKNGLIWNDFYNSKLYIYYKNLRRLAMLTAL